MPLTAEEAILLGLPEDGTLEYEHQRLDTAPQEERKIGRWTLVALILNRTIGSGIFLTPNRVLQGTGCVGGALFLWTLGGLISICALYVWLECGLSMPQHVVRGEAQPRGVPRSGGEKNFLEFMFPDSRSRNSPLRTSLRTTCCFAIMWILLYNLSGNAISFGIQAVTASGYYDPSSDQPPSRAAVLGIAVGVLSLVIVLHSISRRGGILINNGFAIVKVLFLLTIICLGIAKAAGRFGGSGDVIHNNFRKDVFKTQRTDVASWSDSLMLCMYAFSGYEQPFYVLAESKSPRRYFPKYTVLAMLIAFVLFILVNVSYLLVVDKNEVIAASPTALPESTALATLFFDQLFQGDHVKAARAMAAIIAISIFGNLWVMTFTAARVKQEIAKEGILPWSLYLAESYRTPYGMLKQRLSHRSTDDEDVERAPTAAFGLHWFTSVLLIAVTSPIADPRKAYSILVSLYSYTIIALLGCWVSAGLAMIKLRRSKWHWQVRRRYRPWLSPAHVIIYGASTSFMLVATFLPAPRGSPYSREVSGVPWYIVPAIGITAPLWGFLWYCGLIYYERRSGRKLVVERKAYVVPDPDCADEYVQKREVIDHRRRGEYFKPSSSGKASRWNEQEGDGVWET